MRRGNRSTLTIDFAFPVVAASNYPDIEIVMGGGALSGDLSGTLRNMVGIPNEFFETVYRGVIGHHAFGLVPIVMKPKSRGRISLKSTNPFQWPRMVANYFDVADDLDALVEGAKMVGAVRPCLCGDASRIAINEAVHFSPGRLSKWASRRISAGMEPDYTGHRFWAASIWHSAATSIGGAASSGI